jgi:hypothetical protein
MIDFYFHLCSSVAKDRKPKPLIISIPMKSTGWIALILFLSPLYTPSARAAPPHRGRDLQVYLVTFGPGEELWSKFGHDALWIHDPDAGTDLAYNYGMFDFESAHFYKNFILGTMHYWVEGFEVLPTLQFYKSLHRSIWIQQLNLTAQQKADLQDFLQWNVQPDNRYYHYDYYRDNCATRVRDALDRVLHGQLKAQTANVPAHATYRDFTRKAMVGHPAVYTALEYVLGQPVDRPLSQWQEMYLPMQMRQYLRHVKVRGEDGRLVPLITQDTTLYEGTWPMPPKQTPRYWGWYLAAGIGLGLIFSLLSGVGIGRPPTAKWWAKPHPALLGILAVVWTLILGGAGLFLGWGEIFTGHVAIYHNENLLHFNPAAILLVILIPAVLVKQKWAMRPARIVLILVVAGGIVGLLLKTFPFFYQSNWSMIALTLPANLGLLVGMDRLCGHKIALCPAGIFKLLIRKPTQLPIN